MLYKFLIVYIEGEVLCRLERCTGWSPWYRTYPGCTFLGVPPVCSEFQNNITKQKVSVLNNCLVTLFCGCHQNKIWFTTETGLPGPAVREGAAVASICRQPSEAVKLPAQLGFNSCRHTTRYPANIYEKRGHDMRKGDIGAVKSIRFWKLI